MKKSKKSPMRKCMEMLKKMWMKIKKICKR